MSKSVMRAVMGHGLLPIDFPAESDVVLGVVFGEGDYTGTAADGGTCAPIESPPFAERRSRIQLYNEGCEFRLKLSNKAPDEPVEIESMRFIFEVTSLD